MRYLFSGIQVVSKYDDRGRSYWTAPVDANGNNTAVTPTFWDAATGGNQYTNFTTDQAGTTATTPVQPAGGITLPDFYGPDGVSSMWLDDGNGPRVQVFAAQPNATADTQVAALVPASSGSATSAALGAAYVGGTIARGNGIDPAGATDSAAGLQAIIDTGKPVIVPAGTYNVSVPLERVTRLLLMPGATIKATAAMAAVVRTDVTANVKDGAVVGKGTIDGNDLADYCLNPRYFARFEVSGLQLNNGKVGGIKLGDSTAAGRSAEANIHDLHIQRIAPLPVNAGSRGIVVENSGDHSASSIIVNAYETGMYLPPGGNVMVRDVHVWTDPSQGSTKTCFEDHSNNSHYLQCHADTPTQFGFRLYGYQTTLVQCGTYINPTAANATDNVVVAVKLEGANAIATIVGHFFLGGNSTHRLAADVVAADGNYDLVTIVPLVGQYTVTTNAARARQIGLDTRDPITSKQAFAVNPATPTPNAGLNLQVGGKDRWRFVMDGAAESGGNAGSGLLLRRCADDGTILADVLYVTRTGTLNIKSTILMGPGADIIPDAAGTHIGVAATQRLGFWGAAPVAQPQTSGVTAGHTAGTGATVTADSKFTGNWGSTQYTISDIISNLKQAGILKS